METSNNKLQIPKVYCGICGSEASMEDYAEYHEIRGEWTPGGKMVEFEHPAYFKRIWDEDYGQPEIFNRLIYEIVMIDSQCLNCGMDCDAYYEMLLTRQQTMQLAEPGANFMSFRRDRIKNAT